MKTPCAVGSHFMGYGSRVGQVGVPPLRVKGKGVGGGVTPLAAASFGSTPIKQLKLIGGSWGWGVQPVP